MEEPKTQTIFLSIIGIATLLVAIVGATFAWFSITVTGNDKPADIVITSGNLGQVSFEDGTAIDMTAIMPGKFTTKTFTVSQTDPSATGKISYNIVLNVTVIGSGVIEGYEVHTYEYTIGLNNVNANQNAAQGKEFSGYLSVVLTDEGINGN